MKLSLKGQLMTAGSVLVITAAMVISGYSLYRFNQFGNQVTLSAHQGAEEQAIALLSEGARGTAADVGRIIREAEQTTIRLAISGNVEALIRAGNGGERVVSKKAAEALLRDQFRALYQTSFIEIKGKRTPLYAQIRYIDEEGKEVLKMVKGEFDDSLGSRAGQDWFIAGMAKNRGQVYNTGTVITQNTSEPEMRTASPVVIEGRKRGLIVLNVDWAPVAEMLKGKSFGKTGYAYILNEQGVIVNHPKYDLKKAVSLSDAKYGTLAQLVNEKMLKGATGTDRYEFEGQQWIASYEPLQAGDFQYVMVAAVPVREALALADAIDSEASRQFRSLAQTVGLISILVILIGLVVAHYGAKLIAEPIILKEKELEESLADMESTSMTLALDLSEQFSVLQQIRDGDLSVSASESSTNELLAKLGKLINEIITELRGQADSAQESAMEMALCVSEYLDALKKVGEGELSTRVTADAKEALLQQLGVWLNKTFERLENREAQLLHEHQYLHDSVLEITQIMDKISEGDLTVALSKERDDEIGRLKEAVNRMSESLETMVREVREASQQVASASSQVSKSSSEMAESATREAAALEESSSSLVEITSQVQAIADSARKADEVAKLARSAAVRGHESMTKLDEAMDNTLKSGREMATIIKAIEEIAFQTNLLALNAAVEAARAGEHGRGFAVVADEVRNLAQRAAHAAQETSTLIRDNSNRIEGATTLCQTTHKALEDIRAGAEEVTTILTEISATSDIQAKETSAVSTAIESLNKLTQETASASEESAGASEEMSAQARSLSDLVGRFNLQLTAGDGRGAPPLGLPQVEPPPRAGARRPVRGAAGLHGRALPEEVIPLDDKELKDF